jgi:hypothetical protein
VNKKYLDRTGLTDILQKLKAKFASLVHTHKKEDITDYIVDTELSSTSTNPVENKIIKAGFDLVDYKIQTDIDSLRNELKTYVDEMSPGVDAEHNHDDKYYTEAEIDAKLDEAKQYANNIKDDLLNGAGEAYDTLKELGELIDDNVDAIEALESVATNKANKDHNHDDSYDTKGTASTEVATHNTATDAHADIRESISNLQTEVDSKATTSYVDEKIAAIPTPDVSGQINEHNTSDSAHEDIRGLINELNVDKTLTLSDKPADALVVGNTLGYISKVRERNLLPYPYQNISTYPSGARNPLSFASSGNVILADDSLSITDNGDGSITINSDTRTTTNYNLYLFDRIDASNYRGQNMTVSVGEEANQAYGFLGLYVSFYDSEGNAIIVSDPYMSYPFMISSTGFASTDVVPEETDYIEITVSISEGRIYSNITLYPQIEIGSSTEWEPVGLPSVDTRINDLRINAAYIDKEDNEDIPDESTPVIDVVDPMTATEVGSAADAYKTRQAIESMSVGGSASDIAFDNSETGGMSSATNVQDAIVEIGTALGEVYQSFSTAANAIGDALVAKGVSVPEGTSLTDMSALISSNLVNSSSADAIKNALIAKGISVSNNASLSDLATLITNNLHKPPESQSGTVTYVGKIQGGSDGYITITFPKAFSKTPTVSGSVRYLDNNGNAYVSTGTPTFQSVTQTGCVAKVRAMSSSHHTTYVDWTAIAK